MPSRLQRQDLSIQNQLAGRQRPIASTTSGTAASLPKRARKHAHLPRRTCAPGCARHRASAQMPPGRRPLSPPIRFRPATRASARPDGTIGSSISTKAARRPRWPREPPRPGLPHIIAACRTASAGAPAALRRLRRARLPARPDAFAGKQPHRGNSCSPSVARARRSVSSLLRVPASPCAARACNLLELIVDLAQARATAVPPVRPLGPARRPTSRCRCGPVEVRRTGMPRRW